MDGSDSTEREDWDSCLELGVPTMGTAVCEKG
jgi:hypothetical protein